MVGDIEKNVILLKPFIFKKCKEILKQKKIEWYVKSLRKVKSIMIDWNLKISFLISNFSFLETFKNLIKIRKM